MELQFLTSRLVFFRIILFWIGFFVVTTWAKLAYISIMYLLGLTIIGYLVVYIFHYEQSAPLVFKKRKHLYSIKLFNSKKVEVVGLVTIRPNKNYFIVTCNGEEFIIYDRYSFLFPFSFRKEVREKSLIDKFKKLNIEVVSNQ